ncbi:hypothetical protein COX76_02425 [Candidatus Kaiserbacteria bacterium CG_4_10_14_0_2_um_filter_50_16]|nr:MAG: hypothetical protein COX76_02425 [Candidatus Kaiserbacteria bacterium CG_4_10_14_0_2_um_filter_50_16]
MDIEIDRYILVRMTTTLQIRIDAKTKNAAQKTFRSMGLDMSSGVKLYLTQVMHTKSIPFPVWSFDYLPREKKLQIVKEAKKALKYGKSYATIEEAHRDILSEK